MLLLDSNIVIYAAKPEFDSLRQFLSEKKLAVSIVSYVEVLGFHQITDQDKNELQDFFAQTKIIPISGEIAAEAIDLRQRRRMKLGDSLIAATALIENVQLVTNNTRDFKWITDLDLIDPFGPTSQ